MSARGRCALASAVTLCLAASVAPARSSAQAAPPPVVVIAQRNADPLTERALDAIGAGLVDLPVTFLPQRLDGWDDAIANRVERAREIAAATRAVAVIWLDLAAPQHVFLFITDPTGGRILVRNVRADTQDTEAQLETLALIVRGSVKGLLAGGLIGVEPPPEWADQGRGLERFGVSLGYALQLYAPTEPVVHGARIELSFGLARWLYLFAAYRLNLPVKAQSRDVAVDLWTHPFELGLYGRARFSKWALDVGASAIIDVVTFDVVSRDVAIDAVEPKDEITAGLCPFLRISRVLRPVVAVYFSFGLDIEAYNDRYVVALDGESRTVLAPWRVRPMFELGARFTVM